MNLLRYLLAFTISLCISYASAQLSPKSCFDCQSLPLTAKYVYLHHKKNKLESTYAKKLLEKTLQAHFSALHIQYSANDIDHEIEELDTTFQEYLNYDGIAEVVMSADGKVIEGEDIAVCAAILHKQVKATTIREQGPVYDYRHLQKGGMKQTDLDALIIEHMNLNKKSRVGIVWPIGISRLDWIVEQLKALGNTIYVKRFTLKNNGPRHLLNHIEHKNGKEVDKFLTWYFNRTKPPFDMAVIAFETTKPEPEVRAVKKLIRHGVKGGQCLHTEDTYQRSVNTARMTILDNSVHWMNHSTYTLPKKFDGFLKKYKQKVLPSSHRFCIDNGGVLGIYGIRDTGDLDYIFYGKEPEIGGTHLWFYTQRYPHITPDEIIVNPKYHFYYHKLKIMSLPLIQKIKSYVKSDKNTRDIPLIKKHLEKYA